MPVKVWADELQQNFMLAAEQVYLVGQEREKDELKERNADLLKRLAEMEAKLAAKAAGEATEAGGSGAVVQAADPMDAPSSSESDSDSDDDAGVMSQEQSQDET